MTILIRNDGHGLGKVRARKEKNATSPKSPKNPRIANNAVSGLVEPVGWAAVAPAEPVVATSNDSRWYVEGTRRIVGGAARESVEGTREMVGGARESVEGTRDMVGGAKGNVEWAGEGRGGESESFESPGPILSRSSFVSSAGWIGGGLVAPVGYEVSTHLCSVIPLARAQFDPPRGDIEVRVVLIFERAVDGHDAQCSKQGKTVGLK